jgi:hypothetical protein
MRTSILLISVLAMAAGTAALADDAPTAAPKPPRVVYLTGAAALANLAKTNPNHAARAERILAAASELCKPGPETINYASFQASDIRCDGAILRTSNPAKREIAFTLDETRYLALVTVPGGGEFRRVDAPPPRVTPAR